MYFYQILFCLSGWKFSILSLIYYCIFFDQCKGKQNVLLCTSERRNILNQIFAQPMSMYIVQKISSTGTKCPWTYDAHSNPGSNWVKGKIWLYSNVDKHEFAQNYVTCDKNKLYQQHRYTMNKLAINIF